MHELAITESIIENAVPIAEKQGAKRILEIHLSLGELSGIVPSCIEYYFAEISKGTIAQDARIVAVTNPVTIKCSCGYEGPIKVRQTTCPSCNGSDFSVTGGSEYYIDHLVVE